MNELSELSVHARELLRIHIHQKKEQEYVRGMITGLIFSTCIYVGAYMLYKFK